uniref:Uncharacterized protein n=1 Tax=Rhizophora mucronata TaxID=61149 RepID=A0A2P2QQ78_RHIMU
MAAECSWQPRCFGVVLQGSRVLVLVVD